MLRREPLSLVLHQRYRVLHSFMMPRDIRILLLKDRHTNTSPFGVISLRGGWKLVGYAIGVKFIIVVTQTTLSSELTRNR